MIQEHVEQAKHVIDGLAIGTSVAAIMTWIPHFAAIASLIWAGLRIYETIIDIKLKKKKLEK